MKLDGLDHPKTLDLCARLDAPLPLIIGHLELLWSFVATKTPQGNVGKWPNGAIARGAHWQGDPDEFVNALAAAGFLDEDSEHRYLVHDWAQHAPSWVRSKLNRNGGDGFITENRASSDGSSANNDSSADGSRDASADSARAVPHAMPRHAMPRHEVKTKKSNPQHLFDRWYAVYPNKKAKQDARKAWDTIKPDRAMTARLIRAVRLQVRWRHAVRRNDPDAFIPQWKHPAPWLRSGSWEDELVIPEEPKRASEQRRSASDFVMTEFD